MKQEIFVRGLIAGFIAFGLAAHGRKKKSLSVSGALAAIFVGFCSFWISYRFGLILILFYYSSSKLTKLKEEVKAKLEADYLVGGQRDWIQVFANSILATAVCIAYWWFVGEDSHVNFAGRSHFSMSSNLSLSPIFGSYLWVMFVAHYSCSTADTWASELGILSTSKPRLVTSLFLKEVPHGTNGGVSLLGTVASAGGGFFIGQIFWILSYLTVGERTYNPQYPMILVGLVSGVVGSLLDSLLGATLQASYYSDTRKCIVKRPFKKDDNVRCVTGIDILSNEAVNFWSILLTMLLL